ncbi:MarR family transcriptional regulator [Streptomyces finlayi]|uniref:MarR family transcriptional regulator n=1 Tax=Streptomyces finlayi TaxID=67296 RepID=A0A7G7BNC4_9ACTN|nr:MarR family transcriptional regulator [Streptomyces finlayi]QNE76839.1 MarR family transcriptional regulator [Streptomyces finlayi]
MATQHLSAALSGPTSSRPYPKASPGYGKRTAPHQPAPTGREFSLLPERERYVAGFVDHLPDGSAMDVKTLAKQLPLYGQQAVASALTALSVAGHLRRVRRLAGEGDQVRWVFHTYWSRTARDNEWWAAFLAALDHRDAPEAPAPGTASPQPWTLTEPSTPVPAVPAAAEVPPALPPEEPLVAPEPVRGPAVPQQPGPGCPSPAYLALAQLGRVEPRLALSAADCEALQELANGWFARGVDANYLIRALAAGLPEAVGSPVGFIRRRLVTKIPPQLPATRAPDATVGPVRRLTVECTECGAPGRPEALPDGLCGPCRRTTQGLGSTQEPSTEPTPGPDVHAYVSRIRRAVLDAR